MLSQPVFGDRSLTIAFYQAVIDRFDDPLSLSTQALLRECTSASPLVPMESKPFSLSRRVWMQQSN